MISRSEIFEELSKVFDEAKARTLTDVLVRFIEEVQRTLIKGRSTEGGSKPLEEANKDTGQ